jgi:hypothetical protein
VSSFLSFLGTKPKPKFARLIFLGELLVFNLNYAYNFTMEYSSSKQALKVKFKFPDGVTMYCTSNPK